MIELCNDLLNLSCHNATSMPNCNIYREFRITPQEGCLSQSSVFLAIFPVLAVGDVSVGVMMLAGLLITVMTLFIMVIVTINTYILILITTHSTTHNMSPAFTPIAILKQGRKTSSCEWVVFKWSLRSFVDWPPNSPFILWKSFWSKGAFQSSVHYLSLSTFEVWRDWGSDWVTEWPTAVKAWVAIRN